MKRPVDLTRLEREYWHYHVEANPEGGFLVKNLHDPRLPQGLTLCLPAEMDIAMNGDYLDPARFVTDRFEMLAEGLEMNDFGGTSTSVMFCSYDGERKTIVPMDPLDATHVIVRVGWNLLMDADLQGTQAADLNDNVKVVYEWHDTDIDVMRGWDLLIIELGDQLSEDYRRDFSAELERVANLHDIAMRAFEQEKGLYRAQYQELETRARAVGWKMDFGTDDSDFVEVSYKDSHGTHTVEYRYCKAYLNEFQSALVGQEAWNAQMSAPKSE